MRESVSSAVPTHRDPRCGRSCALANLANAGALRGESLGGGELPDLAGEGVAAAGAERERYGYEPDAPRRVRGAVEKAESTPLRSLVTDVRNKKGCTLLAPEARGARGKAVGPVSDRMARGRR